MRLTVLAMSSTLVVATLTPTEAQAKDKEPNLITSVSADIKAAPNFVQPYIGDLTTWDEWTAWNTVRDPDAAWTYDGEAGQVGHSMYWDGPKLKKGRVDLTEIKADDGGLVYDIWFGKKAGERGGQVHAGELTLTPDGDGTKVTWESRLTMGFPATLFKGSIDKALTADFTAGLLMLAKAAEADAMKAAAEAEAEAAKKAAEEAAAAAAAAEAAAKAAEEAAGDAAEDATD